MKQVVLSVWLAPRNLVVLLLRGYRAAISPLYGDVCRYHPSCSAYGLKAVQEHGVVMGTVRSVWRILRCNPWSRGGIADVPLQRVRRYSVTPFGFVTVPRVTASSHGRG